MIPQLLKMLKEAIRQVPAMKYALAVAGIFAVVALAGAFRISPPVALFGAVIILVLMVAMVLFARLTAVGPRNFLLPAQVMMWSFLLLIIATAFLLFTCAFFQWPKPVGELMGRGRNGTNEITSTNAPPPPLPRVLALVQAARLQRGARDYPGAWKTINEAVPLAPDLGMVRNEQVDIAFVWLRDMRVTLPATLTETVQPLIQCLYSALPQEKGIRAADIHAHIGFANTMKWGEGIRGQNVEEEFAEALKLDPMNPFAHAMWGHWLARQRKSLADITNRFELAHQSGREAEYVARLEIYALGWSSDDLERARLMIHLADRLRRSQIDSGEEARNKIFDVVYSDLGRSHTEQVVAMLPAQDHLATFAWVAQGRESNYGTTQGFFRARLTEANGDKAKALALYQAVGPYSLFKQQIAEGMARCTR